MFFRSKKIGKTRPGRQGQTATNTCRADGAVPKSKLSELSWMLKYAETVEKTLQVGITGDIVFTVEDSWEFFCEYIYIYICSCGKPISSIQIYSYSYGYFRGIVDGKFSTSRP